MAEHLDRILVLAIVVLAGIALGYMGCAESLGAAETTRRAER